MRELSEELEQTICIPQEEYQEFARLTARATSVWARAKKDQDFEAFAPTLEKVIGFQEKSLQATGQRTGKRPTTSCWMIMRRASPWRTWNEFFGLLKKGTGSVPQKGNGGRKED